MHRDEREHEHANKSRTERPGIDPLVKPYIDKYEKLSIKPAAMLIALGEESGLGAQPDLIPKYSQLDIRDDIKQIQLSDDQNIFNKSCNLFFIKWSNNNEQISHFLIYFKTNFVDNKSGWYEGFASGIPSQSNEIENSHKHFKKFEDIKDRTPCIKFF